MKRFAKFAALAIAALVALWFLGPRETLDRTFPFDPAAVQTDPDGYLAERESRVRALKPGAEKTIVWADPATRARTRLALVYVHGFSATRREISPVTENLAARLGANLFFTRLKGHGRDGPAMNEARAGDWWRDMREALAIGSRLGEKVVLVGTSTGATLATLAAADPALSENVAGLVLISPNYTFREFPLAPMLAPFARQILPPLLGRERSWEPFNAEQAKWWTHSYPSAAALPVAPIVAEALRLDPAAIRTPALFIFNDGDQVVDHAVTRRIAGEWGGPATILNVEPTAEETPSRHVVTGAIMAPSTVAEVENAGYAFISGL